MSFSVAVMTTTTVSQSNEVSMISCRDWHCQCVEHRNHVNVLCRTLINYCIDASHETILMNRCVGKDLTGWNKLVRPV